MNDRDFVVGQPSGSAGPLLGMRTETVVAFLSAPGVTSKPGGQWPPK